jgi:hypothetical protein
VGLSKIGIQLNGLFEGRDSYVGVLGALILHYPQKMIGFRVRGEFRYGFLEKCFSLLKMFDLNGFASLVV